jgi:hypothetical protein
MIEVGARVLDRESSGAQAEAIKFELEKASTEVRHDLGKTAEQLTTETRAKLNELFGSGESPGAVPQRVEKIVVEAIATAQEAMIKHVTSDDSPLAQVNRVQTEAAKERHTQLEKKVVTLGEELAKMNLQLERAKGEDEKLAAVAAEAEKGTAKGRSYEEAVFEAVDGIARGRGDDCDAIGDTVGDGGKKGDVLVGVDAAAGPARSRIVFEAKDRQLSKNAALAELDGAMEQRTADYAVLVVPSDAELPARTHALHEFNGNKVFAVYDAEDGSTLSLEVAYGLARARTLMDSGAAEGIDAGALRTELECAVQAMEAVRKIKSQLTTATKGIEGAQGLVDTMATDVRGHLTQIELILASAGEDVD